MKKAGFDPGLFSDSSHPCDLTDILYHRHREIIALPPPDPVVAGLG
jgi:hypothetical protein